MSQSCNRSSAPALWNHVDLRAGEEVSRELLEAVFHGDVPGLRLRGFYSESECRTVVERLRGLESGSKKYQGLDLGTVLGIPSHWEFAYTGPPNEWESYFPLVGPANALRRELFAGLPDPVRAVSELFGEAWSHSPVPNATHPRYGREVYAGLVRTGVPKLHCDWARWDFPSLPVVMQAGWNVYLQNPGPGGDLKMYRRLWTHPGEKADSGASRVGNYDLPRELVADVEAETIPCRTGDLVLAPNRFLHEVTPCADPESRTTVAGHLVWLQDGSIAQFS